MFYNYNDYTFNLNMIIYICQHEESIKIVFKDNNIIFIDATGNKKQERLEECNRVFKDITNKLMNRTDV